MAQHLVKCRFCKQQFDKLTEDFIQPTKGWYYHKACYETMPKNEQKEKKDENIFFQILKKYIPEYNYIQSKKLAESYIKKYNFTWSGMAGTLEYHYGVCKASVEGAKDTIGIIPYVYESAKKYWSKVNQYNKNPVQPPKDIKKYFKVEEYTIEKPKVNMRLPHLFFEEDED